MPELLKAFIRTPLKENSTYTYERYTRDIYLFTEGEAKYIRELAPPNLTRQTKILVRRFDQHPALPTYLTHYYSLVVMRELAGIGYIVPQILADANFEFFKYLRQTDTHKILENKSYINETLNISDEKPITIVDSKKI